MGKRGWEEEEGMGKQGRIQDFRKGGLFMNNKEGEGAGWGLRPPS